MRNSKDDRLFAALSYLWILCIIPLLLKKDDRFVLEHAKQGLVLFIIETVAFIFRIFPFFGEYLWNLCLLFFIIMSLYGFIAAISGKSARILFISNLAKKINI